MLSSESVKIDTAKQNWSLKTLKLVFLSREPQDSTTEKSSKKNTVL